MKKFWDFAKNAKTGERELRLEGIIGEDVWLDDETTPKQFCDELFSGNGDLTLWINSCGGDVFAASAIYTALKEYRGKVTVKIDSLAASAASVVAMARDTVLMSPTAMLMLHNPATIAAGDCKELKLALRALDEVKETIINAYQLKTGLSREYISRLMDAETWLNAKKAVEMKFADGILYTDNGADKVQDAIIFSQSIITNSIVGKLKKSVGVSRQNLSSTPSPVKVKKLRRRLEGYLH